ncbi:platelet endothelial aggregation receptor 1, partial [Biomphalaria glabrata]
MLYHSMTSHSLFIPVILLWTERISAPSTVFGKYFITTVPIMNYSQNAVTQYIVFSFFTHYMHVLEVIVHEKFQKPSVYISIDQPQSLTETVLLINMSLLEINVRTYRFNAAEEFSLMVYLFGEESAASFIAIPVSGWGNSYYVVTLSDNPTIQLVSHDMVRIMVTFKFADDIATWSFMNVSYTTGMTMEISLDKWTTFPIQNCTHFSHSDNYDISWTGTKIMGDNSFGVVTGSCFSKTFMCEDAKVTHDQMSSDAALEMLLPQETYGKTFVIPELCVGRKHLGCYFLTAGENNSKVFIHEAEDVVLINLRHAGKSEQRKYQGATYINSTNGIQVAIIWHSQCAGREKNISIVLGDVALSIIIPMPLYYYSYFWKVIDSNRPGGVFYHYYTTIFNQASVPNLKGEHRLSSQISTSNIPGLPDWKFGNYIVNIMGFDNRALQLFASDKRPFGCYVYGVAYQEAFLRPAGFISSPINKCTRLMVSMEPGDLIDNDCDGRVDEEVANERDDDHDAHVDEDLMFLTEAELTKLLLEEERREKELGIVHGGWGEWSMWQCTANCPSPIKIRTRLCDSPTPNNGGRQCAGDASESQDSDCYRKQICPEDCDDYRWDIDCVGTCTMCTSPCDKRTGVCDSCKQGFKSSSTGCNVPCGFNEFGFNCEGNCTYKCGDDCYERINGDCPIHGVWAQWTEWGCTENCKDTRQIRNRKCDNPAPSHGGDFCLGLDTDYRAYTCFSKITCQEDCPPFRWELNCSASCENCIDDCNKFTGSCSRCKKGFKLPLSACLIICSPNEYGENCEGNCLTKCGENCYDGVEGICSVHGGWTDWENWQCTSTCKVSEEIRKRSCTKPRPEHGGRNCIGTDTEMRNATCYKGVICSEDCPPYTWDLNCVRSCNNCIDDCNKMNGSCSSCTKGFKFPEAGCIEACGKFQFGENCAGDCTKKCGEDCLERKTGTCPIHGNWGLWTEWTCAECPDNRLLRSRKCDNPAPNEGGYPCKGTGNETKLSTCYRNIIYCYDECPYKTWSLNCSKTCPHCADDCNKRTGTCSGCLSGFKQPDLGCTKECEVGEYGTNCLGNCTMKCGEDCQDRITGRCPVYGTWMDWAEWHCTRNCSETRLIRYRRCKPNESQSLSMPVRCKGENVEMMKSTCYVTLTCPLDCPDFHWGIKCRACPHCKYDCDKFNASCRKCLPGFQSPETGCQR